MLIIPSQNKSFAFQRSEHVYSLEGNHSAETVSMSTRFEANTQQILDPLTRDSLASQIDTNCVNLLWNEVHSSFKWDPHRIWRSLERVKAPGPGSSSVDDDEAKPIIPTGPYFFEVSDRAFYRGVSERFALVLDMFNISVSLEFVLHTSFWPRESRRLKSAIKTAHSARGPNDGVPDNQSMMDARTKFVRIFRPTTGLNYMTPNPTAVRDAMIELLHPPCASPRSFVGPTIPYRLLEVFS